MNVNVTGMKSYSALLKIPHTVKETMKKQILTISVGCVNIFAKITSLCFPIQTAGMIYEEAFPSKNG